ncbi:MAG: protein kinase, partial [Gemmatimonadales bacterium]|nr:protein kinase [Gemmatimonadales bacterium]
MTDTPAARLAAALHGRYRIGRELGEGGMATVLLADDLKHERRVAIKVMRPDLAAAMGAERFLREIRIAAQLTHPHILGLLDSGRVGEGPDALLYYVMPFVDGETLRARLARDGPLPQREALRYLRELCDALAKAHRAGVVHRDIKPENIFLADGHALLADFGIARAVSAGRDGTAGEPRQATSATALGTSVGTPAYMAPEQATADPATDHRADLYSLGVVAWEMLAGRAPFEAATTHQLVVAHLTQPPRPLDSARPDVDPALAAAVMRCLQKEPAARFADADALAAALEAVAVGGSGAVPTVALPARRPRVTRRPLVLGGLIALVALVALAGAVALRARRPAVAAPPVAAAGADARSLAVLPFTNLSGDPANDYFSDGISEEILDAVARIPGLSVAARTSSFALRGASLDAHAIGTRLRVRHVLDGSVERDGGRVRVRARLADAASGTQLWHEKYDRETRDVFALQDEIAGAIAGALTAQLGSVAAPRTAGGSSDAAAVDEYLRGREALRARTSSHDLRRAERHFVAATARDPSFARAWAGLASSRVLLPDYEGGSVEAATAGAAEAIARALALDSASAEAHAALGYLAKSYRYDWTGAEAALRRALQLAPNDANTHQWYGELLATLGRGDEARTQFERAVALDPESPVAYLALGSWYLAEGDRGRNGAAFDRALALRADFWAIHLWRAWLAMAEGDSAVALDAAARFAAATGQAPGAYQLLARARADAAHRPAARDTIEEWRRDGQQPFIVANWYLAIGDDDRALDALDEVIR